MAKGTLQSWYVRLTKDQVPVEDINPRELNQPIQVPQLLLHLCPECQQPVPESYEPPLTVNSPCDPCLVHCCLHWCALCQQHREMKSHDHR